MRRSCGANGDHCELPLKGDARRQLARGLAGELTRCFRLSVLDAFRNSRNVAGRCSDPASLDYDTGMSKTESSMVELGTDAPAFELTDVVSGRAVGRDDVAGGRTRAAGDVYLRALPLREACGAGTGADRRGL